MPVQDEPFCKPGNLNPQRRRRIALLAVAFVVFVGLGLLISPLARLAVFAAPLFQETSTPTPLPGTGSVAGQVWDDLDGDGMRDPGEPPLAGAEVRAQNLDTAATSSSLSDASGNYRIPGLAPAVYRVTAIPPAGYVVTSQSSYDVAIMSGVVVVLDFGARSQPTPTPTATTEPILDISNAQNVVCGGVYSGDTFNKTNNVSSYGCRPWWDESGPEAVYRLELGASQPLNVTLLNASADLDLFLLRFAVPASCLASGDNYLAYQGQPGVYFLSVDGYKGAAGSYAFRVDCPVDPQATATPTFTPSPTPTLTATGTPTATPTAGEPPAAKRVYLPVLMRSSQPGPTVTLTLQEGLNGYAGTTDTTLDSWEPAVPQGDDNRLRLFYARPPKLTTQMAPVVRFDLSLLPTTAQVQTATLRLYMPSTPLHDVRARAQGLLRPWNEASATWEVAAAGQPWSVPGALGIGVDRTVWASGWQLIAQGAKWYEFDVTPLAQQWASQPQTNFGVILEAGAGDDDASVQALFASREASGSGRPQLTITYSLPAQ
jgi:hypothetical protein